VINAVSAVKRTARLTGPAVLGLLKTRR
jgi:hypothetical protein